MIRRRAPQMLAAWLAIGAGLGCGGVGGSVRPPANGGASPSTSGEDGAAARTIADELSAEASRLAAQARQLEQLRAALGLTGVQTGDLDADIVVQLPR